MGVQWAGPRSDRPQHRAEGTPISTIRRACVKETMRSIGRCNNIIGGHAREEKRAEMMSKSFHPTQPVAHSQLAVELAVPPEVTAMQRPT